MEIKVFSSFFHSFEVGKNASGDIHYYEKQYVKAPNNHVICIDSAEEESHGAKFSSIIGKTFQPEYRIELWATESFKERLKQDFVKLGMKRQIIHYCNGKTVIVNSDDLQLSLSKG
jgi:hypothetical protein